MHSSRKFVIYIPQDFLDNQLTKQPQLLIEITIKAQIGPKVYNLIKPVYKQGSFNTAIKELGSRQPITLQWPQNNNQINFCGSC
jgi:hypothetical protein